MEPSVHTGRPVEKTSEVTLEHPQELERRFSLLSICGIAISTGESWVALGGSLTVAIYNLGPPGVLYGLLVTSCLYWFVAASIAELASAIPSSGTVYHWASITAGPRYGRFCGWFAGWWNFLAWIMGTASLGSFMALQTVTVCVSRQVTFLNRPQLSHKRQSLCILVLVFSSPTSTDVFHYPPGIRSAELAHFRELSRLHLALLFGRPLRKYSAAVYRVGRSICERLRVFDIHPDLCDHAQGQRETLRIQRFCLGGHDE